MTRGAGFIGSHLAEELVKRDHKVTILDNLFFRRWGSFIWSD
ncbi:NAD-dependent epimerase/dehydratase family protein [[Anoxybacillus] calidus]